MKAINKGIFISIFIIGMEYQVNAQTAHKGESKIEVEHKTKEEPATVKEPEIKSEARPEISSPQVVEEHQATPKKEKEEVKPVNSNSESNTTQTATSKSAITLSQLNRPPMRRAPMVKAFVVDTTKK